MNNSLNENRFQCTKCKNPDLKEEGKFLTCVKCGARFKILPGGIVDFLDIPSLNTYLFDEVEIKSFAEENKIPCFIFSESIITNNFRKIRDAFSEKEMTPQVYYSLKTNFNSFILNIINRETQYASASSILEISMAIKHGFKPENISYDGPVKTIEDISEALKLGIRLFNIDSVEEAGLLNNAAQELKTSIFISPRVNLNFGTRYFRLNQVFNERFGFNKHALKKLIKSLPSFKNLELSGINLHIGSQVSNRKIFISSIKKLFNLYDYIKHKTGKDLKHLNFGGGFPAQNIRRNSICSLFYKMLRISRDRFSNPANIFRSIAKIINNELSKRRIKPDIIIQPGRSIVGDAGILVSKIYSIKDNWIFLDASVNYLPESFMSINRKIINISKHKVSKLKRYSISGRTLCADIFNLNIKLPRPDINDIIVIESAGAYSLARANNFTTLTPTVYLIHKSKEVPVLIKEQEKVDDVINRF